jgi:RHS repeat-associated protein
VNRLTSADASAGPDAGMDLAWAYDRYGNRWSQTATGTGGGGATQPSLSFGGTNRADGYSYDAAGNLLNDGLHRYTYDGANRILSIDNQSTGYVYDAEGNRVAKLSSGGTVETVYVLTSGNQQLTELNGAGGWNHTNIYAPGGRLLATYDAPGQPSPGYHYNLTDWLGTKRMQTAAGGNQQETCISNPYGDGLSCTGGVDATEQHFTGKDHDTESGLDYFYARYYSETLGRFMTPDWAAAPARKSIP